MVKITIFFIIFFSAILQLAVLSNVFFWGLGPNILLLLIIFWTTQAGFEKALVKNITAGLVLDLATFCAVGMNIASFALVAFFIGFISKRFLVIARNWRIFVLTITIIFSTLANSLFLNALFLIADYFGKTAIGNAPTSLFSFMLFKEIGLNILFFPLVYFIMKRIESLSFLATRAKIN
jgi:rod shape-determining protein MreD